MIAEETCTLLGRICKNSAKRCACVKREGVEAILNSLRQHKNMNTQAMIWFAIGAIAQGEGLLARQEASETVDAITAAMQSNPDIIVVQKFGSFALPSLCSFEGNAEEMLEAEHAARVIVSAIHGMLKHERVIVDGIDAIHKFSTSSEGARQMCTVGALDAILAVINVLLLETCQIESVESSNMRPEQGLKVCCVTISMMLQKQKPRKSPIYSDAISSISRVMLKYVDHAFLQSSAMKAVGLVSLHLEEQTRYASKQDGIRALLAGLVAHEQNEDVQYAGMRALSTMCRSAMFSTEVAAGVIGDDCLRVLLKHMDRFVQNKDIQFEGIMTISGMAWTGGVHVADSLVQAGCVQRVVQAMKTHEHLPYEPDLECAVHPDILGEGLLTLMAIISSQPGHKARSICKHSS
jgi:hypothetical protein